MKRKGKNLNANTLGRQKIRQCDHSQARWDRTGMRGLESRSHTRTVEFEGQHIISGSCKLTVVLTTLGDESYFDVVLARSRSAGIPVSDP